MDPKIAQCSVGVSSYTVLVVTEGFSFLLLQGLLAFAESSSLPVSIHFDSGGCPVVFGVDDATLAAHFVLATLSDADYSSQSQNHRYDLCVMHVPAEPARGQPTSELVLGRCGCLRACDIFFFFFCPKCVSCILTC
ncbi:hypothetical protein GDO81_023801 [Engystomops pustulosus]|uniref:Uncharacterized protein n=1 Tax=Engystomops pustulosus TaxID=76066 RepID=A0AAV6YVJ6_ENGPU|nr:hypothetical protein GDO81_023801 [Engystomops pustulosus]